MSLYLEIYSMYAWGYICSYMNKLSQVKIFFREKILTFLDKKAIIFIPRRPGGPEGGLCRGAVRPSVRPGTF